MLGSEKDINEEMSESGNKIANECEELGLIKSGQNYKVRCPYHREKTPSCIVSPKKGVFYCFGCDKGGSWDELKKMLLPNKFHIKTIRDMENDWKEYEEKMKKNVFIQDGCIVFKEPNRSNGYFIELDRCITYASILWWIHHLSEKDWFDIDMAKRFIEIAVKENKLKMYGGKG